MGVSVKCPQCGILVDTEGFGYPRCPRCNEYLEKCRYCKNLMPVVDECTHPTIERQLAKYPGDRPHIPDIDAVLNCPYHDTSLPTFEEGARPGWVYPLVRVSLITAIVVIVALGLFRRAMRSLSNPAEQVRLNIDLIAPDVVDTQAPFDLNIVVANHGEESAPVVRVRINQGLFEWFDMEDITPPPYDIQVIGTGRYLVYRDLAPRSEMLIRVRLRGREVGLYMARVKADCPGKSMSREIEHQLEVM